MYLIHMLVGFQFVPKHVPIPNYLLSAASVEPSNLLPTLWPASNISMKLRMAIDQDMLPESRLLWSSYTSLERTFIQTKVVALSKSTLLHYSGPSLIYQFLALTERSNPNG
jgi:hypothetical protein